MAKIWLALTKSIAEALIVVPPRVRLAVAAGVKLVPSISTVTLPALPPEYGEMAGHGQGGGLGDGERVAGRGGGAGDAVGQDVVGPRRQHLRHGDRLARLVGDVGRFLVVVRRRQASPG